MRILCETRKGFIVSNLLFTKLLNKNRIKDKLGKDFFDNVQCLITNYIESHEYHFCFCLRLNLKHYEEYTNSIHEATNCSFKYNSAPIGPDTKIEKSLATVCNNAERTVKKKSKVSSQFFVERKYTQS